MIIGREDRVAFCQLHYDAKFPMIKILYSELELPGGSGEHIRLFSLVRKGIYIIPVYQYWHDTIPLSQAVGMFKEMCRNVEDSYIVSDSDIVEKGLFDGKR